MLSKGKEKAEYYGEEEEDEYEECMVLESGYRLGFEETTPAASAQQQQQQLNEYESHFIDHKEQPSLGNVVIMDGSGGGSVNYSEAVHRMLDIVQKIGMATESELNKLFFAAFTIIRSKLNDMSVEYITNEIAFLSDPRVDFIKRAFLYHVLSFDSSFQSICCSGFVAGLKYKPIDPLDMKFFVEKGLQPLRQDFVHTVITPNEFVEKVRGLVEKGGVHGYLQRNARLW